MRPGRPPKIDRQLLHEYLWETRGRGNFMPFTQAELASEFGVTTATMSLIFKEMAEQGRLRRVGAKFVIYDPEVHQWEHTPEPDSLF
jgi:CRP-like cAMP-binding protein